MIDLFLIPGPETREQQESRKLKQELRKLRATIEEGFAKLDSRLESSAIPPPSDESGGV